MEKEGTERLKRGISLLEVSPSTDSLCQGEILAKSCLKIAEIPHSSNQHQAQEPACSYRRKPLLSFPLLLCNEMFSLMALASWNQTSEGGKTQIQVVVLVGIFPCTAPEQRGGCGAVSKEL